MRIGSWILLAGALLLLASCQQPYRVFAVQVAAADGTPAPMATAARPALSAVSLQSGHGYRGSDPKWDLNRVPAQTLMGLPGMTSNLAAAIVSGRPYRSKRELLKRKILTAGQYARWKDYLVVHREAAKSPGSAATRR